LILFANTLRIVAFGLYAATVCGALWIVLTYYQIYLRERANWIGLVPRHVYLVGISYIIYATSAVAWTFQQWDRPPGPFTVANLTAGTIGLRAMLVMINFQAKRMTP